MKKPETPSIEVDMVPLIDIISLLLMFLIIVGDAKTTAEAIQMKLPRADQAIEIETTRTQGRLVVQLNQDGGVYYAVIQGKAYRLVENGGNQTLIQFLDKQIEWTVTHGLATRNQDKTVNIPVKLRIPEDAPMKEVERLVMTLARVGLNQIQYAAVK